MSGQKIITSVMKELFAIFEKEHCSLFGKENMLHSFFKNKKAYQICIIKIWV